jgi:FKBP-type peptidyl-prolyl cis-trans isomerase
MSICAVLSVLLSGGAAAPARSAESAPAVKALTVSFKMDSRLGGSTYGGERWLSPPTFATSAQEGTIGTVDVRVVGIDGGGHAVTVAPEWTAADPEMVAVTAPKKNEFRITIRRPGESKLTVAAGGLSKELRVKAKTMGAAIQVEITQPPPAEPHGPAASADPASGATNAQSSYALGRAMARRIQEQFPEIDAELATRGVADAFRGGASLYGEAELEKALAAVQYQVHARQTEARKQQAEKNRMDGEALLANNKAKQGVVTRATGLQYRVLKAGDGPKPTINDTVVCHYRGRLADGTEFDDSHRRPRPATFAVKRVIPGWREALLLMPVGSKWQIVIPSELAYGRKGGRGAIGPDMTLVFDVELLAIKDRAPRS